MKKTTKQIAAIIAIVLLVSLSVASLVFACLDFPGSYELFRGFLIAAVFMPLLIWIYIFLYGKLTSKHTIADFHEDTTISDEAVQTSDLQSDSRKKEQ